MQRGVVLSAAVLALGLLCFFCIRTHAPMIQQDVSGRVLNVLAANQIPNQGASVDGRDVLLTGPTGSTQVSEATQKLVASAEGVRVVNIRTTDATPDASTRALKTATQGKLDALLSQDVVEFDSASARLTEHGREVLDQVAPLLAASPASLCEIQGHTDAQGNPNANRELSYRRAIETKNYLVNKGIAPERLETKGYGDTVPIASNETAEGRRKNRRINFVLKEKP
jgi:outer membrane protein OmpA-like peptidoglycan-associated protein